MLKRYGVMLFLAFSLGVIEGAVGQTAAELIVVQAPYVRAVPPGVPNSASYMVLLNNDNRDHALVGVESPVAKVLELHAHTMQDGMMQMRRVGKIELPAGATIGLQPGGLHVMLIGLQQKLVPGEEVPITLLFEDGSKQQIDVPVRKLQMHVDKPME
jgi:copper(I)-binding protein